MHKVNCLCNKNTTGCNKGPGLVLFCFAEDKPHDNVSSDYSKFGDHVIINDRTVVRGLQKTDLLEYVLFFCFFFTAKTLIHIALTANLMWQLLIFGYPKLKI